MDFSFAISLEKSLIVKFLSNNKISLIFFIR